MAKKTSKKQEKAKDPTPEQVAPTVAAGCPPEQEGNIPPTFPLICGVATAVGICHNPVYPPTSPMVCAAAIPAAYYPYGGTAGMQNYPNTTPVVCAHTIPTLACHGHQTYPNTSPVYCGGTTAYFPYGGTMPQTPPPTTPMVCAGTIHTVHYGFHGHDYTPPPQAQAIYSIMPNCPTAFCAQNVVVEEPEDKTSKPKKAPPAKKPKKTKKTKPPTSGKKDDLKVVEGIGPKIEQLLYKADIKTYAELGAARIGTLRKILSDAGNRYAIHDPKTWARQAKLAAAGNWDKLKAWQDELKGGK